MKNDYYAIEIFGVNDDKFSIKQVSGNWVHPVNRIAYESLDKAKEEADKLGIVISRIGSYYEII